MAELTDDKTTIKTLLEQIARIPSATGNVELETIFDDHQSRYQVIAQGWQGKKRTHGCLIHIDVKGDKVWLQHDSTDAAIADSLIERGIAKERIVLGFLPESVRPYTGFAVN